MLHKLYIIFFLLIISTQALAEAEELRLTCTDKKNEASAIHRLADGVVSRKSKHELQIKVAGKTLKYLDTAVDDERENDEQYYFCDRKQGFILISNNDYTLFSGLLINEKTGKVTYGGEEVIFSADRRAYYIQEQPSGMDGSVWKIYSVKGNLSWSGYSFIPRRGDPNFAEAYLDYPKWKENGEFTALAKCISLDFNKPQSIKDKEWKVTLKKIDGVWDWHPKRECSQTKTKS